MRLVAQIILHVSSHDELAVGLRAAVGDLPVVDSVVNVALPAV
jgi:hypothetical protein